MRNEKVRRLVPVGQLRDKLMETRMRWLGHVVRRDEDYVRKKMRQLEMVWKWESE